MRKITEHRTSYKDVQQKRTKRKHLETPDKAVEFWQSFLASARTDNQEMDDSSKKRNFS